ncbi:hypothetical protein ABZ780_25310 [Micromonospora sp. NPDC047467]|uniref:hypothetical protein n=1 Tax=Micromonospora sp. NPDC047467 TaxID=3154814 RepID=UPI0033CC1F05
MAKSDTRSGKSNAWAWPAGILIGLAIGIPLFGSAGGVAFGVAIGVAFAVAFGATTNRAEGGSPGGDPEVAASSTVDGAPIGSSKQDESDGAAGGGPVDGPSRP